jgi:hypothetical protein
MPLALVIIGGFLVLTGIEGNYPDVGAAFNQDVLGQGQTGGGFFQFLVGILGIAVFFRLIGMPNAGRIFLVLVLLVYIMENPKVISALESVGPGGSATTGTTGGAAASPGSGAAASSGTTGV